MTNYLRILLACLFIFLLFIPISFCSQATAQIVYVATDDSGDYKCDGTDDHIEINQALSYIDSMGGGTVWLKSGTYTIDNALIIGSDATLTGDSDSIVTIPNNAGWMENLPLIKSQSNDNVTICGFQIDGNRDNQPEPTGYGWYRLVEFQETTNIKVHDMQMSGSSSDDIKCEFSYVDVNAKNVDIYDNTIYRSGHDCIYILRMNGISVYNNKLTTRTNSGVRLYNSNHADIYDNYITSNGGGNAGIEIQRYSSVPYVTDVEIYNNVIDKTNIYGISVTGNGEYDIDTAKGVNIHHNIIKNVATDWDNPAIAGINVVAWNGTIIENNVIDGCYRNGIMSHEKYSSNPDLWVTSFSGSGYTTYVRNNIITGIVARDGDGFGIHNDLFDTHTIIAENNCLYDNDISNYKGNGITYNNDIYVDPLFADSSNHDYHLKSTAGRISGSGWVFDTISSPLIDSGNPLSDWSNEPESNGDRINIGVYGNTAEASKSVSDEEVIPTTDSTSTQSLVYDNRLRESTPDETLAGSSYIDIGHNDGEERFRDVMKFDLSEYDTTDIVSSATLSLAWYYPADTTRTSDTIVEIYRADDWNPSQVSWSDSAYGTPWNNPGGDWFDKNNVAQGTTPYASVTFKANDIPDNQYYEFDVTELVQEYVSGKYSNTGFFIKARNENNNYIAFYSSEWNDTDQRPKLTIDLTEQDVQRPTASAGSDQTIPAGETVTLDGSGSTDDVGIASYRWDFDESDGIQQEAAGAVVQHTYDTAGIYTATITVADISGNTDSENVIITVIDEEGIPTTSSTSTQSQVYDNRLRESTPDETLAGSSYIDIGHNDGEERFRDVMKFDLSAYDTTDIVSSATLSLTWYYPTATTRNSDTIVEIYRADDWNPNQVSWSNSATGTPWNNPGGDWFDKNNVAQGSTPYASVTFKASNLPDNQYYEFDVTELVQEYVSGKYSNTGFFIKARDENNNYIAFYSSEWSDTNQRPKLTVDLTEQDTQMPTPSADYTSTQTPVYDNRLREASADATLGQNNYIDIGNKKNYGSYRDVIWFDLSDYSETDTITNADLELFWYYPSDSTRDEDTIVDIYRADDWDPDYVSWSNSEAGTQWNNAGGDWFDKNNVAQGSTPYASITFKATDVPDNQYYEFDVTQLVQEFVNGEYGNTGFFLKARDENSNYIAFYSSDISDPDKMPKLTIDHTTGQSSASVPETPLNTAPVINSISARSVDETDTLTFVVSATDADGDALTYSATSLPAGASFNTASGLFSWTPSKGDSGIYTVTFTVTDGDLIDSTTSRITVNELDSAPVVEQNNAPSITLFEPSANTVFEEGSTVNIKVTASDADGQSLSYIIKINGETVSTSADYSWVLDHSSAGTYTIKAVVSDGIDDVSAEHTITITEQTTTITDVPRWDVNEDGIVNVLDITLIGQNYGTTYTGDLPRWDVNQDGVVNILDLSIVSSHMGETTN